MGPTLHSSFLPSDELIFERSKIWSSFLSRIVKEENYSEIFYHEIQSDDEEDSDNGAERSEHKPNNALAEANHFEDSSSSSDEFDVNDLLNETLPVIEERKRKWKESGMDRILDTFDFNAITDKVGSWLSKARLDKSTSHNSCLEDEQIMHFENHQIHFNSDDSLQSADTAKYILSNRKPRVASCTTMTIKRFRYVKGKQKEIQRKYGCDVGQGFDEVFSKRCSDLLSTNKSRQMPRFKTVLPPCSGRMVPGNQTASQEISAPNYGTAKKQRSRHRKKRSDTSRKRSVSSSSSCSISNGSNSYIRPKFRRIHREFKKTKERRACEKIIIVSSESTDCELSPKPTASIVKTLCKSPALPKDLSVAQSSNITCFLPEGVVNSTTLPSASKRDKVMATKFCQLSPISSKTKLNITLEKKPEAKQEANLESDRTITVYTPKLQSIHSEGTSKSSFLLTEEHLRKAIGDKAADRFIKFNAREFPWEFDSTSTIYFKLPPKSEHSPRSESSGDSDEDILNMFGRQGELVQLPQKLNDQES